MAHKETIRLYRSDQVGAVPSLTAGEIAVNLQDKKLFVGGTNGTATNLQFLDQSLQLTVKGTQGNIQFSNSTITDLESDTALKFNFLTDSSFEMPGNLKIGTVVGGSGGSWIQFGDGTTQSSAFRGTVSAIRGGTF